MLALPQAALRTRPAGRSPDQAEPAGTISSHEPAAGILPAMPRNDESCFYMAAQVQGRTLERQADGIRQALCRLANGHGTPEDVASKIAALREQLRLAEVLAIDLTARVSTSRAAIAREPERVSGQPQRFLDLDRG